MEGGAQKWGQKSEVRAQEPDEQVPLKAKGGWFRGEHPCLGAIRYISTSRMRIEKETDTTPEPMVLVARSPRC